MDAEGVLVLGGILILFAAFGVHQGWFRNSARVRWVTRLLGKTGAIILYVVCGTAFIVMGVLMMMGIVR